MKHADPAVAVHDEGVDLVADLRPVVARMSDAEVRAFWRRMAMLGDDILRDDYPEELVDAELREAGLDPEAVAQRGTEFVEKMRGEGLL